MGFLSKIGGIFTGSTLKGASELLKTIDGMTTSGEEKKELRARVIENVLDAQSSVIKAEAAAGGISAKWRPYTMLSFVALIMAHYALFPVIAVIFPAAAPAFAAIILPPELWTLIQVGLGGYVGGRTVEKVTSMLTTAKELKKLRKLGLDKD